MRSNLLVSSQLSTLRVALVGCGAISELYYSPALKQACKLANLDVVALYDPSIARLNVLHQSFPGAQLITDFSELLALRPDLAIVASPPKFHASQSNSLLAASAHVLCEKPMASSATEAEGMLVAAKEAKRLLAIGLFRRFFPALQSIKALVLSGTLGAVKSFRFSEGGPFSWPSASASFFLKQHSKGGVFLDLGVHVLDLVCWWFGEPSSHRYLDDAMGNLEANCQLFLSYANGLTGEVMLSRDTKISNTYVIDFELGTVKWQVGCANQLDILLNDLPFRLRSDLFTNDIPAPTYHGSFLKQLLNFSAAARGTEALLVPGEEGLRSMRLIESCYGSRELMLMPWLSNSELCRARSLTSD